MELLTKEIEKELPGLYETDGIPLDEKVAVAKFFNPSGASTWYAIEGEREGDDFIFFGWCFITEWELGYFSLAELESVNGNRGLGIERDIYFEPTTIANIKEAA